MDKSLKNKAIDIKGKQYVLVSDRILFFNQNFDGSITTELLSQPSDELVVMKATVRVGDLTFTGHSQAKWGDGYINKTSALENCETSAVGRALAMMGIGVIDSVASVDEINKSQTQPAYKPQTRRVLGEDGVERLVEEPKVNRTGDKSLNVSESPQRKRIRELCADLDIPLPPDDKEEWYGICQSVVGKDEPRTAGEAELVISVLETMQQNRQAGL